MTPNCPNCDKLLTNVGYQPTRIGPLLSTEGYKGIIYVCPYCQHVLGVGFDPLALNADTASNAAHEVERQLGPMLSEIVDGLNQLLHKV